MDALLRYLVMVYKYIPSPRSGFRVLKSWSSEGDYDIIIPIAVPTDTMYI